MDAVRLRLAPELGTIDRERKDKKGRPTFNLKWDYRCTTKPGQLFIHILKWPEDGKFELAGLQSKVTRVSLLADGQELKFQQSAANVTIELPKQAPNKIASVIRIEIADEVAKTTNATE